MGVFNELDVLVLNLRTKSSTCLCDNKFDISALAAIHISATATMATKSWKRRLGCLLGPEPVSDPVDCFDEAFVS